MIVVSNTSPLTNLAAIGQFDLLHSLFDNIQVANGVWLELNAGGVEWPGRNEVAQANWVQRHMVNNHMLVIALERDLDHGEAESIALALEQKAELLLMDETEGRHAAQRLGLRVAGTVGILLQAKTKGLIESVRPHLDGLRQKAGFYLTDAIYQSALALAGEN